MTLPEGLTVEEARDRLGKIPARLRRIDRSRAGVLEERNALYVFLLDAGESQATIARLAGVTPTAVAFALGKYGKSRSDAAG